MNDQPKPEELTASAKGSAPIPESPLNDNSPAQNPAFTASATSAASTGSFVEPSVATGTDRPAAHTPTAQPLPSAPTSPWLYEYKTADIVLAWVCWLIGYLFCVVVPITKCLIGTFVFEVLIFIGGTLLVSHRNPGNVRRSLPVTAVSLLLSVAFLVTTNTPIIVCVFLFTCVSWFYMVFTLSGRSEERYPGSYFVSEVARALFVIPFTAPGGLFSALFGARKMADGSGRKMNKVGSTIGWILLGLCIAAVPTVIVALLLSYDQGFTKLLDQIFDLKTIFRQFRQILLGIPVAFLMFGALLAAMTRRERAAWERPVTHVNPAVFPLPVICAALTPLLLLYVIFFISQWDYYMSAFTGVLPGDLTFSAYAREGFFQLCIVAGINAAICVVVSVFTRRRKPDPEKPNRNPAHPVLRIYLTVLSLFTLVLIATALSKMILYVDTYGLTRLRVYSTWFMLLLTVSFLAVILRQLIRKLNLVGVLVTVGTVFFLAISLINVDSLIVRYNVNACLDGNIRTMQGDVLHDAGLSGVLPALEFMDKTDDATDPDMIRVRESTDSYLKDMAKKLAGMKAGEQNVVSLRARAALDRHGYAVSE